VFASRRLDSGQIKSTIAHAPPRKIVKNRPFFLAVPANPFVLSKKDAVLPRRPATGPEVARGNPVRRTFLGCGGRLKKPRRFERLRIRQYYLLIPSKYRLTRSVPARTRSLRCKKKLLASQQDTDL
jgi:hypothetical protein